MDVKGKKFLVVGYGISGQAAAKLLVKQGAEVLAIDESKEQETTMKRRARRKKFTAFKFNLE